MTAKEFLLNKYFPSGYVSKEDQELWFKVNDRAKEEVEMLKEFAWYHVKEALKVALEEVPYGGTDEVRYEDVKGILTCYPKENIK